MFQLTISQMSEFHKRWGNYVLSSNGESCEIRPDAFWIFRIGEFLKSLVILVKYKDHTGKIEGILFDKNGEKAHCCFRIRIRSEGLKVFYNLWPQDEQSERLLKQFMEEA